MRLLRRLRYLLQQRKVEAELAEEIEHHSHMSGDGRAMGNITRAREDSRAVWIWPWLQSVWQDVAYAGRNLRRAPGFTLVALLTLGTAIGLNTSFFTVFNALALRPWPVSDPQRIVKVFATDPRRPNASGGGLGIAEYRFFAEHARAFSGFAATFGQSVRFGFEPFGRSSQAALVGGDHFRVLGIEMHLGRGFLPEEDRLEAPEAVAVLSYSYWRDYFGSDPAILGRRVPLNEIPFTIVGVTPENFLGTADGGGRETSTSHFLRWSSSSRRHRGLTIFSPVRISVVFRCQAAWLRGPCVRKRRPSWRCWTGSSARDFAWMGTASLS